MIELEAWILFFNYKLICFLLCTITKRVRKTVKKNNIHPIKNYTMKNWYNNLKKKLQRIKVLKYKKQPFCNYTVNTNNGTIYLYARKV